MLSRRAFLRTTGVVGTTSIVAARATLDRVLAATSSIADQSPEDVAKETMTIATIRGARSRLRSSRGRRSAARSRSIDRTA